MLDYGILSGLPFKVLSTYSTTCDNLIARRDDSNITFLPLVFTWQANECSFTMPGGLVLGAPLESCPRAPTRLPAVQILRCARMFKPYTACALSAILVQRAGLTSSPQALCPGSKVEAGSGSGSAR